MLVRVRDVLACVLDVLARVLDVFQSHQACETIHGCTGTENGALWTLWV